MTSKNIRYFFTSSSRMLNHVLTVRDRPSTLYGGAAPRQHFPVVSSRRGTFVGRTSATGLAFGTPIEAGGVISAPRLIPTNNTSVNYFSATCNEIFARCDKRPRRGHPIHRRMSRGPAFISSQQPVVLIAGGPNGGRRLVGGEDTKHNARLNAPIVRRTSYMSRRFRTNWLYTPGPSGGPGGPRVQCRLRWVTPGCASL
jgi:hypothetical protein